MGLRCITCLSYIDDLSLRLARHETPSRTGKTSQHRWTHMLRMTRLRRPVKARPE